MPVKHVDGSAGISESCSSAQLLVWCVVWCGDVCEEL